MARVRRRRRSNELRRQFCGFLPSGWRLHGPHSKWREANRPAGAAGNKARAVYQYQDCQGARPYHASDPVCPRRRGDRVNRRGFITLLGGAAAPWPLAARAQQSGKIPTVGYLWHAGSPQEEVPYFEALLEGFARLGYVDGRNIKLEHRFPNETPERFKSMAAELVSLNVDVLMGGAVASPY